MKRLITLAAVFGGVVALSAMVWIYSMTHSVAELQRRGQSDLALASDRLVSNLMRFRQLATWVAQDPRMLADARGGDDPSLVLRRAADMSGALDFVLLDRDRIAVASASGGTHPGWTALPFLQRAYTGALGSALGVSSVFGRRVYYYAAPVFSNAGPVARVLVVIVDLEAIETQFRGSHPAVFMSDAAGRIFFSNRSELVSLDHGPGGADRRALRGSDTVLYQASRRFGAEIWTGSAGRYLPPTALHVARDLPVIGMQAEALIDLQPAIDDAFLQASLIGLLSLLFVTAIFFVANQRRILARANEVLELRVWERTRDLRNLNASLRAEVAEREEAETALKQAQAELVQAEKLSALGKMSAGISHELNQPLMAIQSFAANAATFLDRGDSAAARRNLARIGDLAGRMARIIKNFRAFARQEKDAVNRVDIVQAVQAAIELSQSRLEQHGVTLHLDLPPSPVWVQGGEVRLQQVVLNLVANAIDAMAEAPRREIRVSLRIGAPVVLTVRDTGPGIEAPDKVFEPFYTTKAISETEGVGLGLSISYGLVQSFGGSIHGRNDPDAGAVFTVELQPWAMREAA